MIKENILEPIRITQAEWEIMRVLWNSQTAMTALEIIKILEPNSSWKPKTVRTFLNRLVAKNAIKTERLDRDGQELLHYVPLIDEATTLKTERETFLGRFFGGTVRSMLSCCIEMDEIPTEELEAMREMIDRQVAAKRESEKTF